MTLGWNRSVFSAKKGSGTTAHQKLVRLLPILSARRRQSLALAPDATSTSTTLDPLAALQDIPLSRAEVRPWTTVVKVLCLQNAVLSTKAHQAAYVSANSKTAKLAPRASATNARMAFS